MRHEYLLIFAFTLFALYHIIKAIRTARQFTNHKVPEQLVQLVRQAHAGQPFQTMWDIQVSPAMQDALQQPLMPELLRALEHTKDDNIRRFVNCTLLSHALKAKELSGVVGVTIDIRSDSGIYDYHVESAKLHVTVRHTGDSVNYQWFVESAELV